MSSCTEIKIEKLDVLYERIIANLNSELLLGELHLSLKIVIMYDYTF